MPEQVVQAVEVYQVTAGDVAVVVLVQLALIGLTAVGVLWAVWPRLRAAPDVEAARGETAAGQEKGKPRRSRPRRTGTIHASGVHVPSSEETVFIDTGGGPG